MGKRAYEPSHDRDDKRRRGSFSTNTQYTAAESSVSSLITNDGCSSGQPSTQPRKRRRRTRSETPNDGRLQFCEYTSTLRNRSQQYHVLRKLGQGTFAKVMLCQPYSASTSGSDSSSRASGSPVAIKIVHAIKRYHESTLIEAKMLRDAQRAKCEGVVRLLDDFVFDGHVCLVFPSHGPSIFQVLEKNDFAPFDLQTIRSVATSLLNTLQSLRSLKIIHTDIKPENILFKKGSLFTTYINGRAVVSPVNPEVVLIDFGSAQYDNEYKWDVVQTRNYRAPEVILSEGEWSMESDMWSAGCVLGEMVLGRLLFKTDDDVYHLEDMEQLVGPCWGSYRREADQLLRKSHRTQRNSHPRLKSIVMNAEHAPRTMKSDLLDLLTGMLHLDPAKRLRPTEALSTPFLKVKEWGSR